MTTDPIVIMKIDEAPDPGTSTDSAGTLVIDLEDGTTQPMTPDAEYLGEPFAAFVTQAAALTVEQRAAIENAFQDWLDNGDFMAAFDQASDRIHYALDDAGLGWSCQFGEPDSPPEAGPYIETLRDNGMRGLSYVAAAVLARDLRLVTEADFNTITAWCATAGVELPEPSFTAMRLHGVNDDDVKYAADADEVDRNAKELDRDMSRVPGWPLYAVCTLGVSVSEGRYAGMPGLMWYADYRLVTGADLAVGDDLDTDDRRGSRGIVSIPDEQPSDGTRVVAIGLGETVTVDRDRTYRVVDVDSLVDLDTHTPYLLTGGPLDGRVVARTRQFKLKQYGPAGDGFEWRFADEWPADVERYAWANADGDIVGVTLTWRTPTDNEIESDRSWRERYGDPDAVPPPAPVEMPPAPDAL